MISAEAYDAAERWCRDVVFSMNQDNDDNCNIIIYDPVGFRRALQKASIELDIPIASLQSFLRTISLIHIKKTSPVVRRSLSHFLQQYKEGTSIVALAKSSNFSPYLLARYLVEEISTLGNHQKLLADAMRDPEGILGDINIIAEDFRDSEVRSTHPSNEDDNCDQKRTTRLAAEVRDAIESDSLYGPLHDKQRHMVGIEYEVVLEHELRELGIPFETEADLRDRGTSRTPDILLSCPIAIQAPKADGSGQEWKMICWIDSKAMFGDVETHQSSVLPQAEAYVHRYGPGLVLYWFGHAPLERLDNSQGEIVILSHGLPDSFMWPTGDEDVYQQCIITRLKQKGIKVVAFDMDQTAVSIHSRGRLLRSQLDDFLGKATVDFQKFVPTLFRHGFSLSIATHSDEAEFGDAVKPETHILGSELARALVQRHFPPDIASAFHIIAYNPRAREDGNNDENKIKRYHIRNLVGRFGVSPNEIVFLDDTKNVVDDCINTCGVRAILVDATKGFQISDLLDNL